VGIVELLIHWVIKQSGGLHDVTFI